MSFPTLNIGDLIAKTPIVQGGMGVGISLSRLASAVANEGGIGVIAGAMIGMKEPDVASNPLEANLRALRREIEKAREATQGIIGVNIMVALTTFAEMVRTSIEAKADVIFSGAGLPMDLPKIFNETCERKKEEFKTKLVPIISSGPRRHPHRPQVDVQHRATCPTPSSWKVPKPAGISVSAPNTLLIPTTPSNSLSRRSWKR